LRWKRYRFITHGWDHHVVILERDHGKNNIVFRFPNIRSRDGYYLRELGNEIALLNYLKKRVHVGIPIYTYVSRDRSFAGYEMLAGKELTNARFQKLSDQDRQTIAKQLAEFISTLHSTPQNMIKRCRIRSENVRLYYDRFVRNVKTLLFPSRDLTKNDKQIIKRFLNELRSALEIYEKNKRKVLIHRDLTYIHILWDNQKKRINIIDFSDRVLGDPAGDFTGLFEYGPRFAEKVFRLYKGKKDEHMMDRARLYFKRLPILFMIDSLTRFHCSFNANRKLFRKRFIVK